MDKRSLIEIGLFLILSFSIYMLLIDNNELKKKNDISEMNIKALDNELNESNNSVMVLQLTNSQMEYLNDSINKRIDELKHELKIKDDKLKSYGYIREVISRIDTLYISDTLFVESAVVDTMINDKWYKCNIHLEYPNIITINPEFKNDVYILYNIRKEPVNPSKHKILNVFKRKNKVLYVDVVNESPYVTDEKKRFVNIIK